MSDSTVTYAAIQFAAYMGIREVYLLGIDANYNPIQGVSSGGVVLKVDGTEKNHFHPDYHLPGSLTYLGEVELHIHAVGGAEVPSSYPIPPRSKPKASDVQVTRPTDRVEQPND